MAHSHSGGGNSHDHASLPDRIGNAFKLGIFLNIGFTIVEYAIGISTNSLALISDATHNLSDVGSLLLSWFGLRLAQKVRTNQFTYGYKKGTILASFINAVVLCFVVVTIAWESIERFQSPVVINGNGVIIVAAIGVLINGISAFLFFKDQKKDINIRGAFVHLLVDALVSVGVVVSGVMIKYTGYTWIDPTISLVIAAIIAISTYSLLKESIRLVLDAVPRDIDYEEIKSILEKDPRVKEAHHIHIWPISSTLVSLTGHIELNSCDATMGELIILRKEIKHDLEHHGIGHATIEMELPNIGCSDSHCN
ncbi:cation diffusion facilitator family transporter [Halosquirtibacter xylanolyticus]|uniref:cation diffusion facilitator family transporter n=1 Tax=Halosquirtibacter xylanolyticus TaxID=3374599 RepID=UPI003747A46C|nr:cation diffusion facilitator family transporter [Prolixibacteraceae bacterium]